MPRWSMPAWSDGMGADPETIAAWAAAWAISRGKPAPLPIHNGFYIEDGRPRRKARYVFPDLREDVVDELTKAIEEPWVYLKFCASGAAVAALLPHGWHIAEPGFLMAAEPAAMARPWRMAGGYCASVS